MEQHSFWIIVQFGAALIFIKSDVHSMIVSIFFVQDKTLQVVEDQCVGGSYSEDSIIVR